MAERTHWFGLLSSSIHSNPPDRVYTQGMVGSQFHAEVGDLSMVLQMSSSVSYAPSSQFESLIGHQKCKTVVGLTRYTGELPAT